MNGRTMRSSTLAAALVMSTVIAGCAGFGKTEAPPAAAAPKVDGVAVVVARLSPDAAKQQAELPQFSRDELASVLRRRLQGQGLVAPTANHKVDIVVTDIHLRTGMTASMPGVSGWDDHVHGVVRVTDANGRLLHSAEIRASTAYTLSGRDAGRMAWLYDRFAELAAADLEKVIGAPRTTAAARR